MVSPVIRGRSIGHSLAGIGRAVGMLVVDRLVAGLALSAPRGPHIRASRPRRGWRTGSGRRGRPPTPAGRRTRGSTTGSPARRASSLEAGRVPRAGRVPALHAPFSRVSGRDVTQASADRSARRARSNPRDFPSPRPRATPAETLEPARWPPRPRSRQARASTNSQTGASDEDPHPQSAPSLAVSMCALFIALGGTGYAAVYVATANNSRHLGGQPPSHYVSSNHFGSSHGERFLSAGHTAVLGQNGHFTFTATCSKDGTGQKLVSFDVTANTTADLDGNGPMAAGTKIVDPRRQRRARQHERKAAESRRIRAGRERQQLDRDRLRWRRGRHLLQRRRQLARKATVHGARLLRGVHRVHRPPVAVTGPGADEKARSE